MLLGSWSRHETRRARWDLSDEAIDDTIAPVEAKLSYRRQARHVQAGALS
jgi:hypothetical protein